MDWTGRWHSSWTGPLNRPGVRKTRDTHELPLFASPLAASSPSRRPEAHAHCRLAHTARARTAWQGLLAGSDTTTSLKSVIALQLI